MERSTELLRQSLRDRREKRFVDSRRHLVQAIHFARMDHIEETLIRALGLLAPIEVAADRFEQATPLYEEWIGLARRRRDPLGLANPLHGLGQIFKSQGRTDDAEALLTEALSIYRREVDTAPIDLANTLRSLAEIYAASGRVDEADACWEEALSLFEAIGVRGGVRACREGLHARRKRAA